MQPWLQRLNPKPLTLIGQGTVAATLPRVVPMVGLCRHKSPVVYHTVIKQEGEIVKIDSQT